MSINSVLEHIAEDLIACRLQESDILVAKPKFDINGADLLAFLSVNDGAKFCRIQCKGRSVISSNSNIKIPSKYVTHGFVVILYLEISEDEHLLCCFFEDEIRDWKISPKGEYQLSLSKKNSPEKLVDHKWSCIKAERVKTVISQVDVRTEIAHLQGSANIRFTATGTLTNATP